MRFYLVGGAVRDLLLGRPVSDRDYLVVGCSKEEFAAAFPQAREVGKTFPVFWLDRTEFSFPRAESLSEEVRLRDLTVNAQLLDDEGRIFSHPQGLQDLCDKVLRPASAQSMNDDPLRVFRAARFHAQLPDFVPHDELKQAMSRAASGGLLDTLSPDRVGNELRKALRSPAPGNFLRLLAATGSLSPWFSELEEAAQTPAGPPPHHDCDVLEHTCRIMDRLAGDEIRVWMGLCHDLGKITTPKGKWPRHHGHDRTGRHLAEELAVRLRLPNTFKKAGPVAARWHMTAARYEELRPVTRVGMLMDLHVKGVLLPLFQLVQADSGVDHGPRAREDLAVILEVNLLPEEQGKGEESGRLLLEKRTRTLADSLKKNA